MHQRNPRHKTGSPLEFEMGDDWDQKKISLLQGKELIDEELIGEVAIALSVTPKLSRILRMNQRSIFCQIPIMINVHP
jgi:hypothetical protein